MPAPPDSITAAADVFNHYGLFHADDSLALGVDAYSNTQNVIKPKINHSNTNYDQRISGSVPPLSHDVLHGGWQYTQQIFNAALNYPNATVISLDHPRVILLKGFLSADEVQHMVSIAEGGFQRSEVVSDGDVVSNARTSYGAW